MRALPSAATPTAKTGFIAAWLALLLVKLWLAARLPLFVDEAFYWQEGQHLAWAYSDLPGLTAWLIRIGTTLGGQHVLALRMPFVLLSAALPWLVVAMTRRHVGPGQAWVAGLFALLLPLAGTLGLLALPDVVLGIATLLCLDAGARLLRQVDAASATQLALGMTLGALSHYRFIAVLAVGMLVLAWLPQGRRALRDPRVWIAICAGIAAWAPLIAWNVAHAEAGLRFQLVERHPWRFQENGIRFIGVQGLLVTPLLLLALLAAARDGWRGADPARRWFAACGGLVVVGFFVLGFFADLRRVSFHWPLPGYLALLPLLPDALQRWKRGWRVATGALASLGLCLVLAYYLVMSLPRLRAELADSRYYSGNFAGWDELADAVRTERARLPAGTRLVADHFKIGAELGFVLGDPRIAVLPHALNSDHGRAPQLALWKLERPGRAALGPGPLLLVVGAADLPYKELLARYHQLCAWFGPLPPARVVNVDHGRIRFLLFALDGGDRRGAPCATPAMAWVDAPVAGARVPREFAISGWAFKDGVGLAGVEVLLDGKPVAQARYGLPSPGTRRYWTQTTDPNHPNVGFEARLLAPAGEHWLGLRLHGRDGSTEDWSEQRVIVR